MKILIVEDDEYKLNDIKDFLEKSFPYMKIDYAGSMHSAWNLILLYDYQIVLLDMTIPTYEPSRGEAGGKPITMGGKELLERMDFEDIQIPTIVITMFETFGEDSTVTLKDLETELRSAFPDSFRSIIYYHNAIDDWKEKLQSELEIISKESKP